MSTPLNQTMSPRPWMEDTEVSARSLEELRRQVADAQMTAQKPSQLPLSTTFQARRFRVKEEKYDSVRCVEWDGKTEGGEVHVAKPFFLRRTAYHGKVRDGVTLTSTGISTRTASDGTYTETHAIYPKYLVDDEINGCMGIVGLASVVAKESTGDIRCLWLDMNLGDEPRMWVRSETP